MDVVTLKISYYNKKLSIKINDKEQEINTKKNKYIQIYLDEIFDNVSLCKLWEKICSKSNYVYFRYNVANLGIRLKFCNVFNLNINNKTLLSNVFFKSDDTTLTIDALEIPNEIEINVLIKIIIPSIRFSNLKTHNNWFTTRTDDIEIFSLGITPQIKLQNPNPMFTLVRINRIDDYDKKIKSFKMPLYEKNNGNKTALKKINYNVTFDLYPTQTTNYILQLIQINNENTNNSYKLHFDKECTKCCNRINGCELNLISKVQLCCECNIEMLRTELFNFLGFDTYNKRLYIKIKDFPSYIKDNFHSFPIIVLD